MLQPANQLRLTSNIEPSYRANTAPQFSPAGSAEQIPILLHGSTKAVDVAPPSLSDLLKKSDSLPMVDGRLQFMEYVKNLARRDIHDGVKPAAAPSAPPKPSSASRPSIPPSPPPASAPSSSSVSAPTPTPVRVPIKTPAERDVPPPPQAPQAPQSSSASVPVVSAKPPQQQPLQPKKKSPPREKQSAIEKELKEKQQLSAKSAQIYQESRQNDMKLVQLQQHQQEQSRQMMDLLRAQLEQSEQQIKLLSDFQPQKQAQQAPSKDSNNAIPAHLLAQHKRQAVAARLLLDAQQQQVIPESKIPIPSGVASRRIQRREVSFAPKEKTPSPPLREPELSLEIDSSFASSASSSSSEASLLPMAAPSPFTRMLRQREQKEFEEKELQRQAAQRDALIKTAEERLAKIESKLGPLMQAAAMAAIQQQQQQQPPPATPSTPITPKPVLSYESEPERTPSSLHHRRGRGGAATPSITPPSSSSAMRKSVSLSPQPRKPGSILIATPPASPPPSRTLTRKRSSVASAASDSEAEMVFGKSVVSPKGQGNNSAKKGASASAASQHPVMKMSEQQKRQVDEMIALLERIEQEDKQALQALESGNFQPQKPEPDALSKLFTLMPEQKMEFGASQKEKKKEVEDKAQSKIQLFEAHTDRSISLEEHGQVEPEAEEEEEEALQAPDDSSRRVLDVQIPEEMIRNVMLYRRHYDRFLQMTSVGLSSSDVQLNELVELLSEEILSDLLDVGAKELNNLCDSFVENVVQREFVPSSGK